jgi:hypothetical protein
MILKLNIRLVKRIQIFFSLRVSYDVQRRIRPNRGLIDFVLHEKYND